MKALVISHNLVGDGLYIQPTVAKFVKERPDWQMDLETDNNFIQRIYDGMGVPWQTVWFGSNEDIYSAYDKVLRFPAGDAGKISQDQNCHIAEAYAFMNGIELDEPYGETPFGKMRMIKPFFDAYEAMRLQEKDGWDETCLPFGDGEGYVLFSPFSASCTSQEKDKDGKLLGKKPNKMLPPEKWLSLIEQFRSWGPTRIIGGKKEIPDESWHLTLEEQEFLGLSLPETALLMKRATRLVVTVDNGMGHLAASQDANCVVFYPMVLSPGFIFPWGANYSVFCHLEPNEVKDSQLFELVVRADRHLQLVRKLHT